MSPIELVPTRYGPMWIFSEDPGCSGMLKAYGDFSPLELVTISYYLPEDAVVLDVGAHIGALTIPLAKQVKKVMAFEPQKEARELLEKNVDMHGLRNVEIYPYALGHESGSTYYSLTHSTWEESRGSVGMEPDPFEGAEVAEMRTLDSFNFPQVDFIKLDVEGMEMHVLAGGINTITSLHPTIMAERPSEKTVEDQQNGAFEMLGYYTARMDFPCFVKENFNRNPQDLYPAMAHMMQIAIPFQR